MPLVQNYDILGILIAKMAVVVSWFCSKSLYRLHRIDYMLSRFFSLKFFSVLKLEV